MIETIGEAVRLVCKKLYNKEHVKNVEYLNQRRHGFVQTNKKNYWILFKKSFFMKFGVIFNLNGAGESINKSELDKAIEMRVNHLLFVYPDERVYEIDPRKFKNWAEGNKTIRRTQKTNEKTYSVPIRELNKWTLEPPIKKLDGLNKYA